MVTSLLRDGNVKHLAGSSLLVSQERPTSAGQRTKGQVLLEGEGTLRLAVLTLITSHRPLHTVQFDVRDCYGTGAAVRMPYGPAPHLGYCGGERRADRGDELAFLWRRERITYARVLFALARYPALACAVVDLLPPTVELDKVATCLRLVTVLSSERAHVLHPATAG